ASGTICDPYYFLLLFLYGAGVQFTRDGGQPEEVRRLHSRHPAGPADRGIHRQSAYPADAVGSLVRYGSVRATGRLEGLWQCAVPVRRHQPLDRGGGGDGLHRAASGARDVASVRGFDEESEFARIREAAIMKVRPSVKKICKNCKVVRRRRVVYIICSDQRH